MYILDTQARIQIQASMWASANLSRENTASFGFIFFSKIIFFIKVLWVFEVCVFYLLLA